jgi:hypothetical protein
LEKKYFSVFMYIKVKTKFPALSWWLDILYFILEF